MQEVTSSNPVLVAARLCQNRRAIFVTHSTFRSAVAEHAIISKPNENIGAGCPHYRGVGNELANAYCITILQTDGRAFIG